VEYTEPINSRIFRKADMLSKSQRQDFRRLRSAHLPLGSLCMLYRASAIGALQVVLGADTATVMPSLPLRRTLGPDLQMKSMSVPDQILNAGSYRQLLESIIRAAQAAIAQFDEVFGERA
jgi:restriction system protein